MSRYHFRWCSGCVGGHHMPPLGPKHSFSSCWECWQLRTPGIVFSQSRGSRSQPLPRVSTCSITSSSGPTSLPQDLTTLKGHRSCRAPDGISHGLGCIVVQLLPCPVQLPSLPHRCWSWECSPVKFTSQISISDRVCLPGNPTKTGDYFPASLQLIRRLKGV